MTKSKTWKALSFAIAFFIFLELALQVRAHLRYGNSAVTAVLHRFGLVDNKNLFRYDKELDQYLLEPDVVHSSQKIVTKTNSMGLRSPNINIKKEKSEFRFFVIGASTIQGAGAKNNESLFAYQLENELKNRFSEQKVTFINAGIAGYKVENQIRLFDQVLKGYDPDLVILYTGVNDFEQICKSEKKRDVRRSIIPKLELPKWVLSYELIVKNTTWSKPNKNSIALVTPDEIRPDRYQRKVRKLLNTIRELNVPVYLLANAKSYRKDMPVEKQKALSALSTYYYPCMDLELLYVAYERFNKVLESEAQNDPAVRFIDTEAVLKGGEDYFIDPVHFTERGEYELATFLAQEIGSVFLKDARIADKSLRD